MRQITDKFRDSDGNILWKDVAYHARGIFAVVLAATVLFGGGYFVYSAAHTAYVQWRSGDDYLGEGTEDVEVLISQGMGITAIGDLLTEKEIVKNTRVFRNAVIDADATEKVQAGRYKLKKHLPAAKALELLLKPESRVQLKVVFPEGTTLGQQRSIITASVKLTTQQLEEAEANVSSYNLPSYADGKLEGFLFPSTYEVAEPPNAEALIRTQVKQFRSVADSIKLEERAAEIGRTPREVVITASIIEREVRKKEDMPKVARVIYNRLGKGMKLEMDSTVHYAVGRYDTVTTTDKERETDSPYNTYKVAGLPVAPISNPGQAALEAALSPADTEDLFFVTVNLDTGETVFAKTYEEHLGNVAKFQEYCKTSDKC